ncbi:MAG TPA: selenium cofactor biosynthesis protein YqeC [Candidatus Eremiobacteraeota bacterium]|nr:MAG: hypothetical protein BWY64_01199 [bacterium ADurb.Bin363]HPZ08612.1 selenium cofactor biosynthesis protein YqeC [Candidatus Eremiobacteraeota bacterium]
MKIEEKTLLEALSLSPRECISVIGGGGKTSFASYLSRKLTSMGKSVVFTSTTKIFPPHTGEKEILVFTTESLWLNKIDHALKESKLVFLGAEILSSGKLKGLSEKLCKDVLMKTNTDYLIIEADGSRGKSIKAHSDCEPVVPDFTRLFVSLIGMDCIMKRIDENNCHRQDLLCSILKVNRGDLIDMDLIVSLFKHKRGYLKTLPRKARSIVFLNKVHTMEDYQTAIKLGERLLSLKRIDSVILGHLKPPGETFTLLRK